MGHWASKQVASNALREYQMQNNAASLDRLTGLRSARKDKGKILLLTEAQATYRRVTGNAEALLWGTVLGMVIMLLLMLPFGGWIGWAPDASTHTITHFGRILSSK